MADYLVSYDVETTTREGRRRLRRVARVCEDYGQRVQLSVFECRLDDTLFETFLARVGEVIDGQQDSLRIYRLPPDRAQAVRVLGRDRWRDPDEPLIL
jgi:CRISPR-associated protein Cas2